MLRELPRFRKPVTPGLAPGGATETVRRLATEAVLMMEAADRL